MEIRIACDVKDRADLDDFNEMQGKLKELPEEQYQRLRTEILDSGFAFPVFIWLNPKNKKKMIIGGHQRLKILKRLREEGVKVPPIPYVKIQAADLKQAKRRVLQDVSQYGKIQGQGLFDFMTDAGFKFDDIYTSFDLPDFDMSRFEGQFFSDDEPGPLQTGVDKVTSGLVPEGTVTKVILFYTQAEYVKIIAAASEVSKELGCSNLSQLFATLLERQRKK